MDVPSRHRTKRLARDAVRALPAAGSWLGVLEAAVGRARAVCWRHVLMASAGRAARRWWAMCPAFFCVFRFVRGRAVC